MAGERLGIFVPSLHGGGAERMAALLAAALTRRGHPVDLLLAEAEGPYLATIPPEVRIVDFGKSGVLGCLPQLVRYLRKTPPSTIYSTLSHTNVITLLANVLAGSPSRVVIAECSSFDECRRNYRTLRDRLIRVMMRLTYGRADKILVVADAMVEELRKGVGVARSRLLFLPSPVVPDDFDARSRQPLECPLFGQGRPVIVAAGRLTFEKDFATLIRACALLRHRYDAALVILGEGPERRSLETLSAELGIADHVLLPGFVDNPFPCMRAASVFALSSRFEGMPGVLLQAMACGTPIVSTDCRTGPREVLEDGAWGILVPVGDPIRLAEGLMESLARNEHPDVRKRALGFTVEGAIDGYLDVLVGGGDGEPRE